jgi:hypothetical protein
MDESPLAAGQGVCKSLAEPRPALAESGVREHIKGHISSLPTRLDIAFIVMAWAITSLVIQTDPLPPGSDKKDQILR